MLLLYTVCMPVYSVREVGTARAYRLGREGTPGVIGIVWALVIGDDPNSAVAWAVCALVIADDPRVRRGAAEGCTGRSVRRDGAGLFALA
jgi:hypothetical protein